MQYWYPIVYFYIFCIVVHDSTVFAADRYPCYIDVSSYETVNAECKFTIDRNKTSQASDQPKKMNIWQVVCHIITGTG